MKVGGSVGKIVLEVNVDDDSKLCGESVRFIHDVVMGGVAYVLFLVYRVVGIVGSVLYRIGCIS
jgi:hypothetical protein